MNKKISYMGPDRWRIPLAIAANSTQIKPIQQFEPNWVDDGDALDANQKVKNLKSNVIWCVSQ